MRRVFAVLNERAGALLGRDPAEIRREVAAALTTPTCAADVVHARGQGICRAIDAALTRDYDTYVVGGGDGSVSYAARRLAGTQKTLGVLPLGTLNLLARDLGMPADLSGALESLGRAQPRAIDLGVLNGRPFHTISGVGFFS